MLLWASAQAIHGGYAILSSRLEVPCACSTCCKKQEHLFRWFRSGWYSQQKKDLVARPCNWLYSGLNKRSPGHRYLLRRITGELPCLGSQFMQMRHSSVGYSTPFHQLQNLCLKNRLDLAVDLLLGMDQKGPVYPCNMYQLLLKSCAERRALTQAKRVHAHMVKHELESITVLGECIVSTFVKCGALKDALQVFNRLTNRTVYSWTAIISGYATSGRGHEALMMYQQMQENGVEPNAYTFMSLIKACGSIADLEQGKRIHAEVVKFRCEGDLFIRSCLVEMYGKCGSIVNAENVFHLFSHRDVVTWTVMLAAYAQHGQAEKALQLYGLMREEGICPTDRTYVATLQACGMLAEQEQRIVVDGRSTKVRSLGKGREIHADTRGKGFASDAFVGSTLIDMYRKCGSIVDAHLVFDGLAHRDVVAWTVLIAGYVEQGQAGEALQLYEQMREEGVSPDVCTFVSTLQACSMLAEQRDDLVGGEFTNPKPLELGKEVHANAEKKGYGSNVFVCNTLISMYGKCGSILEARTLFDMLLHKDVVSFNVMLTAYIEHGLGEDALEMYVEMQERGVSPVLRTFVSVLQACGMIAEKEERATVDGQPTKLKSLQDGKAVHAEAQRKGYDSDVFVGSTLVCMYVKCGSTVDAWSIFDGLPQPNVVAWVAMLAAYVEQGAAEKVLELYEQMQEEGISVDAWSFVSALQACGMLADKQEHVIANGLSTISSCLQKGKILHAHSWMKGYGSHMYVGNTLISMYAKCGSFLDAQDSFDKLCHQDVVSWNVLLRAYVEQGLGEKILELYRKMLEEGVSADGWTFVSVLQGCGMLAEDEWDSSINGECIKVNAIEKGRAIHADAWMKHYDSDAFIGSTLVSMYGKCGSDADARTVFKRLPKRDVVSWNAMLGVYVDHGLAAETFELYEQMWEEAISPDNITLVSVLNACRNTGNLAMVRQIHNSLVSTTDKLSPILANTLIGAYGRCAAMTDAQAVFDALPQPTEVSWNALIAGYARHGNWVDCLDRYEKMRLSVVEPNGVTFLALLSACSHAGFVHEGIEFFESMSRDHHIFPQIEHYITIIDLLGRAGDFLQVEALLSAMPMQPDLNVWLCLLAACRKHGKVDVGKKAFDCVLFLQPKHSAAYLLMWNIFADAGLWDRAREVNNLRQQAGAWERPAQSWVEHEQELSSFEVGDQQHRQQQRLYHLLSKINSAGKSSLSF